MKLSTIRKAASVNQTVNDVDKADVKKKEVHPVLAPLLIALFILLIVLVAFIFYKGIRENLKWIKKNEEEQQASEINESRV